MITLTNEEQITFNQFLTNVAPQLIDETGAVRSNVTLSAEDVLIAITGLGIAARYDAGYQGISVEEAQANVFAQFTTGLDEETATLLREAFTCTQQDVPVFDPIVVSAPAPAGNTFTNVLDLIGKILVKSGTIIYKSLAFCVSKVSGVLKTVFNWTVAKAQAIGTWMQKQYSVFMPWAGNKIVAIYDWTKGKVMMISRAVMTGVKWICNTVWSILSTVFGWVLSVLKAVDQQLGKLFDSSKPVVQTVKLTKSCTISLPFVVILQKAAYTVVNVTLGNQADMATLRAEIAGSGELV